MLTEHDLDFGNNRLHYACGDANGPPLLLLHGVTRCWQNWTILLPHLMPRWQTVALDFRGHGLSSRRPGAYLVVDYVEDVRRLFLERCRDGVIYGHSLGAMTALALAADADVGVRAVILEDPPFHTMGNRLQATAYHGMFAGMQRLIAAGPPSVADLQRGLADLQLAAPGAAKSVRLGDVRDGTSLRFTARSLTRLDPDVFEPILAGRWLDGYDLDALLARVRCPVLLLQADTAAGGMLTEEDASRIERLLPDCCRIRFPGEGHLIHWMQTEKTLRLITGFLESVR